MSTVADLIAVLNTKLCGYTTGFTDAEKIAALDAGKEQVWMALSEAARNGRTNWFGVSAPYTVSAGDRSVQLGAAVHDVLSVDAEGVPLRPSAFHKQNWRDQRRNVDDQAVDDLSEVLWLVTGSNPPVLEIGPKLLDDLDVTVYYNKSLTTWSATGTSVDDIPAPYRESIVNYAAWFLTNAMQDNVSETWWRAWEAGYKMMLGVAMDRQDRAGVVTNEDYDSE